MFGILAIGDRQYKIVVGEACVFEKIDKQEGECQTMMRFYQKRKNY